ncbi:MAG: class I SAM-dependent methyltransferase [Rhodospirillaceae bacterium]
MRCRHCGAQLSHTLIDLSFAPPSNAYLTEEDLSAPEIYYPLRVLVCDSCWLVQTEDFSTAAELFCPDYSYFSSTSSSYVRHAEKYSEAIISDLKLSETSFVLEIGSNDGYLLKNFIRAGIPCLGIEPTKSTATAAQNLGINVIQEFFGIKLAKRLNRQGQKADLIIANNVFAHVPEVGNFAEALKIVLNDRGTITLEFPHLLELIQNKQFDTIYHEHFSYFSFHSAQAILASRGLRVFDVEKLETHGGSLRVFACHDNDPRAPTQRVLKLLDSENKFGVTDIKTYRNFSNDILDLKLKFLEFLLRQKINKKSVVGYGAAAKGNTLLNSVGVKGDLLPAVFDAAESKQGKFLPGSHIPILHPKFIPEFKPDYILILPWNIKEEVVTAVKQNLDLGIKGTRFLVAVPDIQIFD